MHKISGHKKVINKEEKLSQKLSTAKMHLKRGKIKLYTKLSTLSTFFCGLEKPEFTRLVALLPSSHG